MPSALSLSGFGVAFGEHAVLRSIDLEVGESGVVTLMGPGGAGKSTLVRTIAGQNDAQPLLRTRGHASYLGRPLHACETRPFLLAQSARLMIASVLENVAIGFRDRHALTQREQRARALSILAELGLTRLVERIDARVIDLSLGDQRALAVARAVASEAAVLMLDEPTVGMPESDRAALIELIAREARRRGVVYITHNRRDAVELGGRVALLLNGRIVEDADAVSFFAAPTTTAGKHFVATGTCYVDPLDDAPPSEDAVETPRERASRPTVRPPVSARVASPRIPRGLHWVRRGALAGMPRPGLLVDLEEDIAGLYSLGITTLLSLEETRTVPLELLARYSIDSLWCPIDDMAAPSVGVALELCRELQARIASGGSVAVHCRAGLGRTGTILAAYLVFEGQAALEALEAVRCVQPRFVQSDEQIEFLSTFAACCRDAEKSTHSNV